MDEEDKDMLQEEKTKKEKHFVTRREFYICMVILLVVVFWQGNKISYQIQDKGNEIQNHLQSSLSSQIGDIPNGIEMAMEEADYPLQEGSVTVVDADRKKKTAMIAIKAVPKTYKDGMTMTFFLACDGKESILIEAERKEDRSFVANKEIPLCQEVEVKAVIRQGDTEQIQLVDRIDGLQDSLYPSIHGNISYSIHYGSKPTLSFGECQVYFAPPENTAWLEEDTENFQLREAKAEVFCNGKHIEKIPLKRVEDISYESQVYEGTGTKKFIPKEGDEITVIFKGVARTGVQYQYILEKGHWSIKENSQGEFEGVAEDVYGTLAGEDRMTIQ